MRRAIASAITCAVAVTALVLPAAGAGAADQQRTLAARRTRVAFDVRNVNRTPVVCDTDGKRYTISGWRYDPVDEGVGSRRAVTVLVHGLALSKVFFTFERRNAYSLARNLARHGHTVVVIDRLGYGRSDRPNGFVSCVGGQADITNQIVRQLHSGEYVAYGTAPAYPRVFLGGHGLGGMLAQIAAYSFQDVNALVVMTYSDVRVSDYARRVVARAVSACEAKKPDSRGYVSIVPNRRTFKRVFFFPPAARFGVFWTAYRHANRDPCGDLLSYAAGVAADRAHLGEVTVPTLVMTGQRDSMYPPPAAKRQANLLSGARSVEISPLRATGNALTLHVTRLRLAKRLDAWLNERTPRLAG